MFVPRLTPWAKERRPSDWEGGEGGEKKGDLSDWSVFPGLEKRERWSNGPLYENAMGRPVGQKQTQDPSLRSG